MKFEISIQYWKLEYNSYFEPEDNGEYETGRSHEQGKCVLTDRRLRISKLDFIIVNRSFTICKLDL